MKTYLTYGALSAAAGLLLNVAMFFAGAHDNPGKSTAIGIVGFLLIIASWIVCIVLGTRARRAQIPPEQDFGYGRAFVAGLLITVFAALFGVVGGMIYFAVINPEFSRLLYEQQVAKMEAIGRAPPESALKVMRLLMSPLGLSLMGALQIFFCGLIISLITGAVQKRAGNGLPPPPVA